MIDVTNMIRPAVESQNAGWVIGVTADLTPGVYSFKTTIPSLEVTWDSPSPAAPLVAPADGSTTPSTTPTLQVGAVTDVDPGQNPPLYNFILHAGKPVNLGVEPRSSCGEGSSIWHSGYVQNVTSQTVPAGILQDGVTYWWTVATMGYTFPPYPTCSGPWKFKVDRRLGNSGVSPMQTAGPFAINTANGNVMVGGSSHQVATLGGNIGVNLTYNSQAKVETGLRASYVGGTWPESFLPFTATWDTPAFATRVDPNIDFDWKDKGPLTGDRLDNWLGKWTGYVTVPVDGTYCFGTKADDGTAVWIGGTAVLSNWTDQVATDKPCTTTVVLKAGEPKSIVVWYYDRASTASIQLKTYNSSAGGDGVVPSSWLSTELDNAGPGWTMSAGDVAISGARVTGSGVSLTRSDGSMVEFTKSPSGAYTGPPGDGTRVFVDPTSNGISVSDDAGVTYQFDANGLLTSAVSAVDDRQPAATQMIWSGNPIRLTGMKDPVSNKTVNLYYGGDANCTMPPGGFAIANGLLCKVSSAAFDSNTTDLFYISGRLARIVTPGPTTVDYGYDGANRITSVRDSLANDAIAATLRASDATTMWEMSYDGSGRASVATAPAPTAGATRQTYTVGYVSAPSGGTLGESTVTLSGVSNPQGWSQKLRYDTSFRTRELFDQINLKTEINYDGATDRVAYTDTAVGTAQAMRTATTYDTSVVFNSLSRPTVQYGPAPPSAFNVSGGVATPNMSMPVPSTTTTYDGGINGLAVAWWDDAPAVGETYVSPNRPSFRGAPKKHTVIANDLAFNWSTGSVHPDLPADNFSDRWTGLIYMATAGNYQFNAIADDGLRVTIDDQLLINDWYQPNVNQISPVVSFTAGWHRIQIDHREDVAGTGFTIAWKPPGAGSFTFVPVGSLKPDLGLVTSVTAPAGTVTNTGYGDPALGLPTSTVTDPGGLGLITTTGYESQGVGSYLRRTARSLPAGASSTNTYTHYGPTDVPATPTCAGTGVTVTAVAQRGFANTSLAADPSTSGGSGGISRQSIVDATGRPVAAKTAGDAKWSCTAYDARGRVSATTYPASASSGPYGERTVTSAYSIGGDPFLSSITDSAGTITTRIDLLGRVTETKDTLGVVTHTDYDVAGRATLATVFNSSGTVLERSGPTYNTTGSGVNQLNQQRWSNAAATVIGYNYTTLTPLGAMPVPGSWSVLATAHYDGVGRIDYTEYLNGVRTTNGFDSYQRAVSITHTKGASTLYSDVVIRDVAGRVVDRTVNGTDPRAGNPNYVYDNAGRLTDWWERDVNAGSNVSGTYRFAYTGSNFSTTCAGIAGANASSGLNSNRVEQSVTTSGGTVNTVYCYDYADRIRKVAPSSGTNPYSAGFAYDAHGNTTTVGAETWSFDGANRHLKTVSGATTVEYTRDAADRIVTRSVNGVVVSKQGYTGAGDTSDLVLDNTGALKEITVGLVGGGLYTWRPFSAEVWSHGNTHGDHVITTNSAGSQTGTAGSYDPFGNPIGTTAIDNSNGNMDFGWHGQAQRALEHETSVLPTIEMGARPYQTALGRFLAADPVEGGTPNDYVYVSDPVNDSDLTGTATDCGGGRTAAQCNSARLRAVQGEARTRAAFLRRFRNCLSTLGCPKPQTGPRNPTNTYTGAPQPSSSMPRLRGSSDHDSSVLSDVFAWGKARFQSFGGQALNFAQAMLRGLASKRGPAMGIMPCRPPDSAVDYCNPSEGDAVA